METIRGKKSRRLEAAELYQMVGAHENVLIDLGTGDGRFVLQAARRDSSLLAIGLDACRENLQEASRRAPGNALFIVANALALPEELAGLAGQLTINFPWGSLLAGLLAGDRALMDGLQRVARPGALLEVRLNASALVEAGCLPEEASQRVCAALGVAGFRLHPAQTLDADSLRGLPTTWARRMAFGRRPEAIYLRARRACLQIHASSATAGR